MLFSFRKQYLFLLCLEQKNELIIDEVKAKQIQQLLTVYEIKNQVRSLYYQIEYLQYNKQKLLSLDSLYNEFIGVANL